jgi:toxin ParE1/3/4
VRVARRLRLSGPAQRDLAEIAAYTRRTWGEIQACAYLAALRDQLRELRETPEIGRPRPDLDDGLRSFPVGQHIVFYRASCSHLDVVRIPHGRMDPRDRVVD